MCKETQFNVLKAENSEGKHANSADLTWAHRIPMGPVCLSVCLSVCDRYVNILTEGNYKI